MKAPKPRVYSPDELRRVLETAFGPATDWELATLAAPHYFTTQLSVYRWMTGAKPIRGPAARVTYDLAKDHAAKRNAE